MDALRLRSRIFSALRFFLFEDPSLVVGMIDGSFGFDLLTGFDEPVDLARACFDMFGYLFDVDFRSRKFPWCSILSFGVELRNIYIVISLWVVKAEVEK